MLQLKLAVYLVLWAQESLESMAADLSKCRAREMELAPVVLIDNLKCFMGLLVAKVGG